MENLNFFKNCFAGELAATSNLFGCLPDGNLDYRPHKINRSAREIVSHILSHVFDLDTILNNIVCNETMNYDFTDSTDAVLKFEGLCEKVVHSLEIQDSDSWDKEQVELVIEGKPFITLSRKQMMWFFFFDIIHHRGQLSSYVRPMGGKNPAIYGYSADTV
jgi:uncharacterized damage-inducible protein DinB